MNTAPNVYLGRGIYSVSEASRLAKVSSQNVRRWLFGYSSRSADYDVHHDPVISHDYESIDDKPALSFLDLIQVRFVAAFRDLGVSLQEIRKAADRASELLDNEHPFATKRFFTDRRRILAEITHDGQDPELVTLTQRQYEIHDALIPYLHEGIDFAEFDLAQRWWPMGRRNPVIIDPRRNFGRPTISESGVPTESLLLAVQAAGSEAAAALWYEVSEAEVRAAIDFERQFAA